MRRTLDSPEATQQLGCMVGEACTGGEVLLLHGGLGAGKTCFVQGLARGAGVPGEQPVTSCTYVLHAEYHGRLTLHHVDLYRLGTADAGPALCLDELFEAPHTVTAVEWAEYLGTRTPPAHLDVAIDVVGPTERAFAFTPQAPRYGRLLAQVLARPSVPGRSS